MSKFKYVGSELDLFAAMWNWKAYWSQQIHPFLRGDILEVGAGIGSNTRFLDRGGGAGRWVCLEPDPALAGQLVKTFGGPEPRRAYETVCGTLESLAGQQFDAIIYIDVLEHIDNDREELNRAASQLKPGGHLIVLSPAHQRLFSPFDAAIGHFRRYNRSMLRTILPASLRLERMRYLDCAGLILSAANMLFLRQSMPTQAQLRFWDRWIVPISRVLDKVFLYSVGKTIIAVWRLTTTPDSSRDGSERVEWLCKKWNLRFTRLELAVYPTRLWPERLTGDENRSDFTTNRSGPPVSTKEINRWSLAKCSIKRGMLGA